MKYALSVALLLICAIGYSQDNLAKHLQDVSVTIRASGSEGSGTLITRKVLVKGKEESVNFVWTAGHVVAGLRQVRTVIENGKERLVVEFKPATVIQNLVEDGRKVGELNYEAKVIKYSNASSGEDLALLLVRKLNLVNSTTKFYLPEDKDQEVIPIGTEVYHVGSLLGNGGSNSMTRGIVSQVGRVLNLSADGTIFDQTTATAFPGSSGGGIFLTETSGDNKGLYIGMLVRGAGETFNLMVPIRRMKAWATKNSVLWALYDNIQVPSMGELVNLSVEDGTEGAAKSSTFEFEEESYPTRIKLYLSDKDRIPRSKYSLGYVWDTFDINTPNEK